MNSHHIHVSSDAFHINETPPECNIIHNQPQSRTELGIMPTTQPI